VVNVSQHLLHGSPPSQPGAGGQQQHLQRPGGSPPTMEGVASPGQAKANIAAMRKARRSKAVAEGM
jgi:hypothetical protein